MKDLAFNPSPPYVMHIDFNSCFASIEQQANPLLRGKAVVVAAYNTPRGCILAASIEAKKLGIKTGMRILEAKKLYPPLVVLIPDPWKYRSVHLALRKIISGYTEKFAPKSIDEFVLDLEGCPSVRTRSLERVAREIKTEIKKQVGEWLTVSIGIAPNRYLAKVAAGLHKPDGLDEINKDNFLDCYSKLKLTDLPYIKIGNAVRLAGVGVYTVLDFYQASLPRLKVAFASIDSYYWYLKLRGWEINDVSFARRSYGNSFALPKPLVSPEGLSPTLSKLTEKVSARMRMAGYSARGVHLGLTYRDWSFWHKGVTFPRELFESREIYKEAYRILSLSPRLKPVREIAVSCFNLIKDKSFQLNIFENALVKKKLTENIDSLNNRWGLGSVASARMFLTDPGWVCDRIAFDGIKELEEFTLQS